MARTRGVDVAHRRKLAMHGADTLFTKKVDMIYVCVRDDDLARSTIFNIDGSLSLSHFLFLSLSLSLSFCLSMCMHLT